jgi:hypothetical protein
MKRSILAVTVVFGLLAQDAAFAGQAVPALPRQVDLAWDELPPIVVEQKISTVLADGTKLQGDVLAIREESLVLDVQKSSRKKAYPLGQTEIPRSSLTEIGIIRHRSAAMRIVGGLLGGIGGLFGSVGLVYLFDNAAAAWLVFIVVPLSAVAGYYAGKLADQYTTRVHIRPDASVTASASEEQ